jgi:hypothetical protein
MNKRISHTIFALLLAAVPAFAQFEGVIEMKMTMSGMGDQGGGGGTMNAAVSKAGSRAEINMQMGPMNMKMVTLQKTDTPDIIYRINDADKTYSEMNLPKMKEMAGQQMKAKKYTVEKLGQETILGYKTQHVLVKDADAREGKGMNLEMWVSKDLLDYATYSKLQARRGRAGNEEGMVKALKDADADGMPLKSIATTPEGMKITMEVTKIDKKSLPASTFEIPAGYTKSEGGLMDMMGGMSGSQADEGRKRVGDAQKKMEDAMKNMTPEQREMIQKMMKQQKAGGQ